MVPLVFVMTRAISEYAVETGMAVGFKARREEFTQPNNQRNGRR